MTWGLGHGSVYGGGPLVATGSTLAAIAGVPVTFNFTDEADSPLLPGSWEHYALEYDGAGAVAWLQEPDPDDYFRIVDGLGLWAFTRAPALPGPATPYAERGYAAGPSGVLEGRNARASVVVRQPVALLDAEADELRFNVGIALRLDPVTGSWVGARMRAVWQSGVWVTPLILEVVRATGGDPVVLSSIVPALTPDLLDIWATQQNAELLVELRGDTLIATLDGIITTSAQVPADGEARVALLVETARRYDADIVPLPSVVAFQVLSLRDMERLGPPPAIPGASHLEAPSFPMMSLPLRDLLDGNILKQISGRQFMFEREVEVIVAEHLKFRFDQGEVIRSHERLSTQAFVSCTRDLHYERSKKKGQ